MKKAVSKRIKITKTGKIIRRKMGVGHFRAKKTNKQKMKKRLPVKLAVVDRKSLIRNLNLK